MHRLLRLLLSHVAHSRHLLVFCREKALRLVREIHVQVNGHALLHALGLRHRWRDHRLHLLLLGREIQLETQLQV